MGLDWVLQTKVKDGHAAAHAEVSEKLTAVRVKLNEAWATWSAAQPKDSADTMYDVFREAHIELCKEEARLREEQDSHEVEPMEILGAPRIGIDAVATAWLRRAYRQDPYMQERFRTEEALLAAEHGKYVPELAKVQEGLGKVTGMMAGATSFRGKVIAYAGRFINAELAEQAYQDMDPDEMLAYADEIEAPAKEWMRTNGHVGDEVDDGYTTNLEDPQESIPVELPEEYWQALHCLQGAEWLRFWANHGFSMHAWY